MLVTQQPVLRRFWYPVVPLDQIQAEPKWFQLLGEPLVLWMDQDGHPRAVKDRCCHRSAQLSQGKVEKGELICPYHGWTFAPSGELVHIIVNMATPIDDGTSQIVQFCLRNDTEAETTAAEAKAFDRTVTLEDKAILETTDFDVPLELKWEQHMATDQPGILMRHRFSRLFKAHGEPEATHKKATYYQKTEMLV